jgi:hypothetical protein
MDDGYNQYRFYKMFRPFGKNGILILVSVFDQCAGDDVMRQRWIKNVGFFEPRFNWKSLRKTLEVGFECRGYLCTVFFE